MVWYDIHHSCGHTRQQQIYGTNVNGERERKADGLGERPCSDCLRQANDERNRLAAERSAAEGWPPLQGSKRQVAWAHAIRADAVDVVTARVRDAYVSTPELEQAAVMGILAQSREASWWIDHRDFRVWFFLVEKRRSWAEALAQIPAGATLAQIQQEFADSATRVELDQAMFRADVAHDAGQITAEQFDAFESLWLKRCDELQ
jgi:hypothetical protein